MANWSLLREERINKGLPEYANVDKSLYEHIYKFQEDELLPKPVVTTEFYPDLQEHGKLNKLMSKNYILKKKFGTNRHVLKDFEDPNPQKYGGQYGLQHLRDQYDKDFLQKIR